MERQRHIVQASTAYAPLTPSLALNLAAPQTWPAAVIPAALGVSLASLGGPVSLSLSVTMLIIVVLMQSAVNTLNDYYDFKKGADSADDNVEASDSVLVYNKVRPRSVLLLGLAFLACAFLLGIYPILVAGLAPLGIGVVGALFVVFYSAGQVPLSYLPLGEVASGFVMGGLIPLAFHAVLTGRLDFMVLLWALPVMVGIGLIMATNNTSDIEKDRASGRHTLAVGLGRTQAVRAYAVGLILWVMLLLVESAFIFTTGFLLIVFGLVAALPFLRLLAAGRLAPEARVRSMGAIASLNLVLGAFYCAVILASCSLMPAW